MLFVLFFSFALFGLLFGAKIQIFLGFHEKHYLCTKYFIMKNTIFTTIILAALVFAGCKEEPKQTSFDKKAALEFLYAYMPLGDSVDYSEGYYRECIHYAFLAKQELPWGASIPEREFKHFVVPVRVNNEGLDRFRATYYEELKNRVKDLSLKDAVLEVNHWCHEHVNYKGSDSRTSAPKTAFGLSRLDA